MKKISYYTKLLVGVAMMLSVVSCNDFINVQPSGQEDEEQQFSSIRGFRNAMYGAYGSMATSDLYGGNLGFGFVDQLGQIFGYDNSSETSYFVGQYDYMRSDVRSIVDAIWTKQYQVIAYVNNIIDQTEHAKFEHAELPLMRGECYGLRAFMHFDLVRLFAEDYGQSNASTRGI
ncbi:MAG: RagB/SusD family nutrient uptake outer membrane protein, partial [Prevotella sp.]|uniref:RagB/SusD family nutrient uptake outer membrane protein n=1 Tax=Prevotella sp. TaxID=59823 RepID=UPI001CACAB38